MTRKEKIWSFMNENMKIPMTAEEMKVMLSVPENADDEFMSILYELESEGKIIKTKKKRYATSSSLGFVTGKFIANERGFGFVEIDGIDDLFISPNNIGGALHGDFVMAKITVKSDNEKRSEGEIIKIIKPAEHKIVGRFSHDKHGSFVIPFYKKYSKDVHINRELSGEAKNGDLVIAEIVKRGIGVLCPEGKIISVIGDINTPGMDILAVIKSRNIPYEFSEDILKEAESVAKIVTKDEIERRRDLRQEQIITIDGDDAKDLDDAIHVKKLSNGNFELGVHIADVGNFVCQNGKIDREAYARGTSIYLADRVIPMLPEILSNGVCSLNEGEDRLTVSVIMEINKNGSVVNYDIFESVICSSKRLTYNDVTAVLEHDITKCEKLKNLVPMLENMRELQNILTNKRVCRGSIDFNLGEARIILNENGEPVDVVKRERGISNSIIEEFMLVCNETVAEHMFWLNVPFIYRVHEEPDPESIKEFSKFITSLGYKIKHLGGKIHPRELAELIRGISGKQEEVIISRVALRSLMKARYSHENTGHFGLAAKYYCHFTSPIRRYPDLAIHRIIKDSLNGKLNIDKLAGFVVDAARQSSDREIEANDVERTVEDMKKAEFMQCRLGDVCSAIITSVTSFGIFATLENTIEGLIRLADMKDDYYVYDDKMKKLFGRHTGKTYSIGDKIEVCVARADSLSGEIDFVINNKNQSAHKKLLKNKYNAEKQKHYSRVKTAKYLRKKRKKR